MARKAFSWTAGHLSDWLGYLLVKIMYFALRKRSLETRFKVIWIISRIILFIAHGKRKKIERNISLIRPDLSEKQIKIVALDVVRTITRSWAAMLGNEYSRSIESFNTFEVEGAEELLQYYLDGQKIIAVADHVGPIDEMAGVIAFFGIKVYVPAEDLRPTWLFDLMQRLRMTRGDILYEPLLRGQALSKAKEQFRHGRIVLFLVDIPTKSGVLCQIGNGVARFPAGPVKLALEQGATIFPVLPSWQKGRKGLRLHIAPPFKLTRTVDQQHDIETNTRRLIEEVFAPHIQENHGAWLRALWVNLEEIGQKK